MVIIMGNFTTTCSKHSFVEMQPSFRNVDDKYCNSVYFLVLIYAYIHFLVIEAEAYDSRAAVKSFDKSSLKHVETDEKTVLPTAQGITQFIRFTL